MNKIKIIELDISKIKEYDNNAKIHTKEQIEQIKKSIEEYGFNDPIAIDENYMIVEGHGRLKALKELGYKNIPAIQLSHLEENQKKAYSLIHNKLTLNTTFDYEKLEYELENLDINLDYYGFEKVFEESDLDDLFAEIEEKKEVQKEVFCPHCGKNIYSEDD